MDGVLALSQAMPGEIILFTAGGYALQYQLGTTGAIPPSLTSSSRKWKGCWRVSKTAHAFSSRFPTISSRWSMRQEDNLSSRSCRPARARSIPRQRVSSWRSQQAAAAEAAAVRLQLRLQRQLVPPSSRRLDASGPLDAMRQSCHIPRAATSPYPHGGVHPLSERRNQKTFILFVEPP